VPWLVVTGALLGGGALAAQENASVSRARAAYEELDYAAAIVTAQDALREPLSQEERVSVYELLGFAYGALDSTRQAIGAFQRLIFLAPDREPDVERVSPRITSLYASALGQVLVVRRVRIDTATFVAGTGGVPVRFEVSRAARTSTRVIGPGVDLVIDSQVVAGSAVIFWQALRPDSTPLPPAAYEVIVTAKEGERNEYGSPPVPFRVDHGRVDTLPSLTSLPGYAELPEMVRPPADWRPMALTLLYTGAASAGLLALQKDDLGSGPRTAMFSISGVALATGLVLSLRKPDPRPSPTNILYNQLLRELLSQRNAEISRENATRHAQVLVSITPGR
jgi:hypothetical protein